MRYTVRLAQRAEVMQLPKIELAAAEQYQPYLDALELTPDLLTDIAPVSFMLRAQRDHRLWVAEVPSEDVKAPPLSQPFTPAIVGFVLTRALTDSFFIVEIDVLPAYGRCGIGTALMQAACEAGTAKGFNTITLTTFRRVPWTIPFYRRLGFNILPPEAWNDELLAITEHEERYGFKREHRVVMQRRL
ncbi:MAG: GNAT family N-acetyltransferase [Cyanobacteria bacterium J06648_16]